MTLGANLATHDEAATPSATDFLNFRDGAGKIGQLFDLVGGDAVRKYGYGDGGLRSRENCWDPNTWSWEDCSCHDPKASSTDTTRECLEPSYQILADNYMTDYLWCSCPGPNGGGTDNPGAGGGGGIGGNGGGGPCTGGNACDPACAGPLPPGVMFMKGVPCNDNDGDNEDDIGDCNSCDSCLTKAMNDPQNAAMLTALAAKGCDPNPSCGLGPVGGCDDGGGGYDYSSGHITMCDQNFSPADLRHELIHAMQFCGQPGRIAGPAGPPVPETPPSIACKEYQAALCSGQNRLRPVVSCIMSLYLWCQSQGPLGPCPLTVTLAKTPPLSRTPGGKWLANQCRRAARNPECKDCSGFTGH